MEKEYESKSLITKLQYDKIIKYFEKDIIDRTSQTNYYFDTEDNYFKNNNMALRIRKKNNIYELTLKHRTNDGNNEYNFSINKEDINTIKNGNLTNYDFPIDRVEFNKFNEISFTTIRTKIKYKDNIIEIDETNFNVTTDYEIEVESTSMSSSEIIIKEFLQFFKIQYTRSDPKIKRYHTYNN